MKILNFVFYGFAGLMMSACSTQLTYSNLPRLGFMYSKQIDLAYPGPVRSLGEVAVVSHQAALDIVSLDGRKDYAFTSWNERGFHKSGAYQLHVSPGTHILEFCFSFSGPNIGARCMTTYSKRLEVKAGDMKFLELYMHGKTWSVGDVDMDPSDRDIVIREFEESMQKPQTMSSKKTDTPALAP